MATRTATLDGHTLPGARLPDLDRRRGVPRRRRRGRGGGRPSGCGRATRRRAGRSASAWTGWTTGRGCRRSSRRWSSYGSATRSSASASPSSRSRCPRRTDIEAYDELTQKVERQVWEINERFGTAGGAPSTWSKRSLPAERLAVLLPGGGPVHRQLAAGRDEPGRQGVRRQPGGRPRRAAPLAVRRRGGGAGRVPAR